MVKRYSLFLSTLAIAFLVSPSLTLAQYCSSPYETDCAYFQPQPTCTNLVCQLPPEGCYYQNQLTYSCDASVPVTCGTLVCPQVVQTSGVEATPPPAGGPTSSPVAQVTQKSLPPIEVKELPKTGPAETGLLLGALLPTGLLLRKYGRGLKSTFSEYFLQEERNSKKSA